MQNAIMKRLLEKRTQWLLEESTYCNEFIYIMLKKSIILIFEMTSDFNIHDK